MLSIPANTRVPTTSEEHQSRIVNSRNNRALHGDAPLGGQGLNLDLQDGLNRNRKRPPRWRAGTDRLLDSEHAERPPTVADAVENSRMQSELRSTEPSPKQRVGWSRN